MPGLSVEELGRAIERLEEALLAFRQTPRNLMYRDSVIKRFEFTFEIAQSALRRFVSEYSVHLKDREHITFPNLIRTASQDGVLREGYDVWHQFREARNRTSHTYNEEQAVAVIRVVPEFLIEVRFLYRRLCEEMKAGPGGERSMSEAFGSSPLQLPEDQATVVRHVLQKIIPNRAVWAFGSRATGRLLKRFSDLDLAVEGELTWRERGSLAEAFEESLLSIKVDVVELDVITPEFRRRIEADFVPVQTGCSAESGCRS